MTAEGCRRWREQLGALALGGLDEAERAAVQAHLEGCSECRAEADALAPVALALQRVDPEHLEHPQRPPAHLARRVMAGVRRERRERRQRRTRMGLAFAGAAAAVVVAIVVASSLLGGGRSSTHVQTVSFNTGRSGLELNAALAPRAWGTEVHMYVHGARRGSLCHVWVRRSGGGRLAAGSFRYRYEDADDAAVLTTALPAARVRAVGLEVGGRTYVAPLPHRDSTT